MNRYKPTPVMKFFTASLVLALICWGCAAQPDRTPEQTDRAAADTSGTILLPDSLDAESYTRDTTSMGQLLYIPVYSHIYQQDRKKTFNLTATLSIRNTDPFRSFSIDKVSYYDSHGALIQHYLEQPITLSPLSSTSYVVEERDLRGGVGANFLVSWRSEKPINPPVVEAVMISTSQQQGISFLSEGRVLKSY